VTHPASPRLSGATRRDFLTVSAAAAAGATLATLTPAVHAAGSDVLKVGLIGCGDRGTGAATQALKADPNVKLTAVGDMFADHIEKKLKVLRDDADVAAKVDVKPENCFVGFDAYKQVLASGVDVVILTTPPHFRPLHLKAAVEAGKHVFCEKPVAVDAPGVQSVMASCGEAKKRSLSVVSGLCWRYHHGKRETLKRVQEGAVGDIVAMHTMYYAGPLWSFPREKGWSDMEWQLRNWLYFTWLSGDHIVEQHIHSLDKMAWAMKDEYPKLAYGTGGRQWRTDPAFGHIWDHFAITYEWANGVKLFGYCRQQKVAHKETSDFVMGTKGTAALMQHTVSGENAWSYKPPKGDPDDMYQNEHDELFASIRKGEPINNGDYMCKSTLMAILGRMAGYTGQIVTWEQAMHSKEDLTPAKYELGELAVPPVAVPGVTKFI
jgi:predicted dehydrogenase